MCFWDLYKGDFPVILEECKDGLMGCFRISIIRGDFGRGLGGLGIGLGWDIALFGVAGHGFQCELKTFTMDFATKLLHVWDFWTFVFRKWCSGDPPLPLPP